MSPTSVCWKRSIRKVPVCASSSLGKENDGGTPSPWWKESAGCRSSSPWKEMTTSGFHPALPCSNWHSKGGPTTCKWLCRSVWRARTIGRCASKHFQPPVPFAWTWPVADRAVPAVRWVVPTYPWYPGTGATILRLMGQSTCPPRLAMVVIACFPDRSVALVQPRSAPQG